MNRKLSDSQIEQIVQRYTSGERVASLARSFGVSEAAISRWLKKKGIYRRGTNRKYSVTESYFDRIDTEEKAYWLGFLTADGHVGEYDIVLALSTKDREHLEKFKAALKAEHPIVEVTSQYGKPISRIGICSRRMAAALRKHGLESNKTFTIEPCPNVPAELERHYWRGAVDGDGWIQKRKSWVKSEKQLCRGEDHWRRK